MASSSLAPIVAHSSPRVDTGSPRRNRSALAFHCHRISWRPSAIRWRIASSSRAAVSSEEKISVVAQPRAEGGLEQTYVMVKPDGVQRGLVGEIISRFEKKGFRLAGLKMFQCPEDLAKKHYEELQEKPFFPKLVKYITSGPVVCMAWEGPGVVASARKLIGSTNPLQAEPGTIRGDLAVAVGRNVIHGSDSVANGEREIGLWFGEAELCKWQPELTPWLLE
ncbi:hypothetical protein SELMODRAFT_443584 [Selaginella moellendorffii]|uniref:Nucleoside diphosphate kinase n=1 Tax=Selaginella moellendorffii TaxID=88036 RepID=D8S2E3_SELML|nr:nucleoside diphosphate kinase II, chloroplastic [Selaginella moellendorffii]EFJ21616.1 hypothetical protein SELMODRAFT_443584 [Selaginella moellendorffii]|eukprot:XP_002977612.1 nucleoside diphosphate kinase II, chloroplastic [Selaginella moellendorffii]